MIPEKNRKEWFNLVTGKEKYNLSNFVLQMKVSQAITDVNSGRVNPERAIEEIHSLCTKYEKAVVQDMKEIFG